ncbi:MAG: hypothetical protein HOK52_08780, partial [Candidatus Marinimicrobia bacterium]|nr:hypothetical protein [Candidatus Neomarinimicrobiota bacterium]
MSFSVDQAEQTIISTNHLLFYGDNHGQTVQDIEFYIKNPSDFCQKFSVEIDKSSIEDIFIDNAINLMLNRYRIDMDNDGSWEQNWTSADSKVIDHHYPEPLNGVSQIHYIKFQADYVEALGTTVTTTKYIPIIIYATPIVYNNNNNDFFVQLDNFSISDKKPILLVEGFDPLNTRYPSYYYSLSNDLIIESLSPNNYTTFILNFNNGGEDMRINSDVLLNALNKISEICPNHLVTLVGLSMGGVIGHYTLSKAENDNIAHNVGVFISYDSPQQGANINYSLQSYIGGLDPSLIPQIQDLHSALNSMASKQLLIQNFFDVIESNGHGAEYNSFYNEMVSYGYPDQCTNIAVSNGSLQASFDTSILSQPLFTLEGEEFGEGGDIITLYPTAIDIGPGSLNNLGFRIFSELLFSLGPFMIDYGYLEVEIHFDPVFIPTWSALDLQEVAFDNNYNISNYTSSNFDVTITQDGTYYHSEVTQNTIDELLNILENGIVNVQLKNEYNGDNLPNTTLTVIGVESGIQSGATIDLANQTNYQIVTDHPKIEDSSLMHHHWNNDFDEFSLKKDVHIEHGVSSQIAIFNDYSTLIISNNFGIDLQFHDPWYLENPDADPSDWNQPDEFRPLNEQDDGYGNIQVFLNQNDGFDPDLPIYHIKAPKYYASQDAIYEFSGWSVSPENSASIGSNHNTAVVFHQAGATISPTYNNQINNQAGLFIIEADDKLSIPAGAVIPFKSSPSTNDYSEYFPYEFSQNNSFVLVLEGELIVGERATLKGDGAGLWSGIQLGEEASLNLNNVKIQDAFVGIQFLGSSNHHDRTIPIENVVFENNLVGLWKFETYGANCEYYMDDIRIKNCTFIDNQYSIYTNAYLSLDNCPDPSANGGQNISLINNIFYNTEAWLLIINQLNSSYNFFYDTQLLNEDLDETNIINESDPLFTDISQGDFTLLPNSPCINAGHPDLDGDGVSWENDIDDQDPDGTRMDMGAYYFDAVPPAPENLTSAFVSEPSCQNCHNVSSAVELSWDELSITDLSYYTIYRAENEGNCIRCHEANNHEPLGERRELMDDPFILGKD